MKTANDARGESAAVGQAHGPPAGKRVLRQARVARTRPPHRQPRARAPGQAHGARGLRLRQPLLGRVRDRGDPQGRGARRDRRGGVHARDADHDRHPRHPGDPAVLVPPDDQGLPERRRRLHRHEGQLRAASRADRRRRSAHGLRAHGVRLRRGRHRGRHVRGARSLPVSRLAVGLLHLVHRVGQPAWGAGIRTDVRRAHVLLHLHDVPDARDRTLPGVHGIAAPVAHPAGRRRVPPAP